MTAQQLSALPPDIDAPDSTDGRDGQYAFQPSTARVWRKINGRWLPIAEAQNLSRTRK